MKQRKICLIYALANALLFGLCPVTTYAAEPFAEHAVLHAAKFNAKKAKKNISVTYKKVGNGILAICKNKNSYPVSLSGTVKFLDAGNTVLSTEKDSVACLGAKKKCVLFFKTPLTDTGDYTVYHSYKKSIKVSRTEYKDYSDKIITTTNLQPTMFNLSALNSSSKKLDVIRISCVLYDGSDQIAGYVQKFVSCYDKGSSVLETISHPSVCPSPSKVKVFVDCAYQY